MSQPAARITDLHTCPMVTGVVPHVGGPILPPGHVQTLIGGLPAARAGDLCTCVGPPAAIAKGSATVMIGGMPAARMGDSTAHGGVIVGGFPKVLIGDSGGGGGGGGAGAGLAENALATFRSRTVERRAMLAEAAESGTPFCQQCEAARRKPEPPPPDHLAQRASLVAAAAGGAPFCEECDRARRSEPAPELGVPPSEAHRAALRDAAELGMPFFEATDDPGGPSR